MKTKPKVEEERSAACFDVEFNTYHNKKYQKLPSDTVTLKIEDFITVEVGGWGTNIKITIPPGSKISQYPRANGSTSIALQPPKKAKSSLFTQDGLVQAVKKVIGG